MPSGTPLSLQPRAARSALAEHGGPGLTPFVALLHDGGVRLPFIVLELEEAVQALQVRDLPPQGLRLRLVLRHLLVGALPQHAHLDLGLLPAGDQPQSGTSEGSAWGGGVGVAWGRPGVDGQVAAIQMKNFLGSQKGMGMEGPSGHTGGLLGARRLL